MAASALSLREREEIRAGIERGDTNTQIAEVIDRHRSTINVEIKRNGGRSKYSAVRADQRARCQRQRSRGSKIGSDPDLFAHIQRRLNAKDSPMTISIELARGVWGITREVSHETIYQAIYAGTFGTIRTPHLGRRKRKQRKQRTPGGHSLGQFRSVHNRPAPAAGREQVGHLEGDLIVGAMNKSAVITVVERASRKCWIGTVASKKAADLTTGLTKLLEHIPIIETLTWDQGAEIAQWETIEQSTGITIYITDPKSPWQRPSNENLNAHIRRHVGKGTDLNRFTQTDLDQIAHRLNTTPRRSLGWHTANDTYTQTVAITD